MYLGGMFDHRIDLFAAGVVFYHLLAGVPPFVGTPEKIMFKVCYETPLPPSVVARQPALRPFDAVVLKALARRPEDRFSSAAEFLETLRPVLAAGDPERTLACFMADMPPEWFRAMRDGPQWPLFARMAPTVQADAEALAWTQSKPRRELWRDVAGPAVVLLGREAPLFFRVAAASLVANLPDAHQVDVPGSGHRWPPAEMAAALDRLLRS